MSSHSKTVRFPEAAAGRVSVAGPKVDSNGNRRTSN